MCALAGEVGGFMGLLMGASVMTLIELLDLIIYNLFRKAKARQNATHRLSAKVADSSLSFSNKNAANA